MRAKYRSQSPLVQRITIDEKLTEELMRIVVAGLIPEEGDFSDKPAAWSDETEILIKREEYPASLGMTGAQAKKWPWGSIYEGQVFLQGYFKSNKKRADKSEFLISTKKRNFTCINDKIKENVKRIYYFALAGSTTNGKAD